MCIVYIWPQWFSILMQSYFSHQLQYIAMEKSKGQQSYFPYQLQYCTVDKQREAVMIINHISLCVLWSPDNVDYSGSRLFHCSYRTGHGAVPVVFTDMNGWGSYCKVRFLRGKVFAQIVIILNLRGLKYWICHSKRSSDIWLDFMRVNALYLYWRFVWIHGDAFMRKEGNWIKFVCLIS